MATPTQRFLSGLLTRGLECGLLAADDVVRHASAEVLAFHLPNGLKAKLLGASLGAGRMSPALVLEVLGVDALVEHLPAPVLWACVAEAAARALAGEQPAAAPSAPPAAASSARRGASPSSASPAPLPAPMAAAPAPASPPPAATDDPLFPEEWATPPEASEAESDDDDFVEVVEESPVGADGEATLGVVSDALDQLAAWPAEEEKTGVPEVEEPRPSRKRR